MARAEAATTLGDGWRPKVLEPSPPADTTEPYLADDPLAEPPGDGTVVSPLGRADAPDGTTWTDLVSRQPDLAWYAREHWLASWRRLQPLPANYAATRLALHRLAVYVITPLRRDANGRIGLRYVHNGFGTPFFPGSDGADVQIRVTGTELVRQEGAEATGGPITSLAAAAGLVGGAVDREWVGELDVPPLGDPDAELPIDPASAGTLADWFGFAFSVLEELRADPESAAADVTRPQLWPEHFDPAIELGSDDGRTRASYGLSPGDAQRGDPEPYLYVSAWYPEHLGHDPFWNSTSFPGAVLRYRDLVAAADQRRAALTFLRKGRSLLLGG